MHRCSAVALALLIGIGIGHVRCDAAPQDVIRTTVREVLLDMVVRNAHGHLVTDLKPGEVMVYEDGVRQNVRAFRLVAGSEVRIEDQKQAAEAQAAGPPFNPLRTVNVVCLILNDLNAETRAFAFDAARKFVNQELHPNTCIGVFSLDASGLRPIFPFSNSRERLLKAVELAAVNQLPAVNLSAGYAGAGGPSLASETPKTSPLNGDDQLAGFKGKVRQDMTSVPNYTCLETINRTRRAPPLREFLPIDTVRLQVSSVAGKEMFARAGAASFSDEDITSLVPGGLIGSGMFASLARSLFVKGKGTLTHKGKENLAGHASVRYDFRLTREESGFKVQVYNNLQPLAFKGSFWFDPVSFDLLRLEAHADALPVDLNVEDASIRTPYARTHIGNSDALLPKRSELTVTYLAGVTERDVIVFSDCHEYGSESKIIFDAPAGPH